MPEKELEVKLTADIRDLEKKFQEILKRTDSIEKNFDDFSRSSKAAFDSISHGAKEASKDLTALQKARQKFTRGFVDGMKNISKKLLATAAILGGTFTAAMVKGFKSNIEFRKQLGLISTMMDRTIPQMMEFGETLRDLSVDYGLVGREATDAGFKITSAVGDTENNLKILSDASKFNAVTFGQLNESIDALINTEKALGGATGTLTGEISDLFVEAGRLGDYQTSDFVKAFRDPLPFINSLGISVTELAATFSSTVGPFGQVNEVGTKTKALFSNLLKPNELLQKAIEKIGFSTARAAIETKGFVPFLQALKAEAERSGVGFTKLFESVEASSIAIPLASTASKEFFEELKQLQNATGATDKAFAKITEGVGSTAHKMKQLQAAFQVFTERATDAAVESGRTNDAIAKMRDIFSSPDFARGVGRITNMLAGYIATTLEAVAALFEFVALSEKTTARLKTQGDNYLDLRGKFNRFLDVVAVGSGSIEKYNEAIRKGGKDAMLFEEATAGVTALLDDIKEFEKIDVSEDPAKKTAELLRIMKLLREGNYGELLARDYKKFQDELRGGITPKITKELKDLGDAAGVAGTKTKIAAEKIKQSLDFGQPIDELEESLDGLEKAFDFKFDTQQLEGVSGLIDEVSDVLQNGERAQEAFNRQIEIEGKLLDEASGVLSEHAKLVEILNGEYGAGIPILKDSEKEREKLIKAIMKMTGATREEAAAIVDNYLEWQRLKESITSALYVLSDAAGVLGPFIGLSEKAAGAIGGLSSGFAEMMSGNLIGGAMSILGDFGNIAEGVIDILHGGKEPVLSFSDAINQAGDLMEYFGVEGEQAKNTLALFLQEVAEGNRELSDFSGFIQDTTRNLDTMGESVWGSMIGLDGLSDSMSDFEKLMNEVNRTVGDTRKELENVSDIEAIFAAGAAGPGQFQNQIEILNNRFAQMVQAGTPVAEAIQLLDGAFDSLTNSAEKLGLTGSESFQELLKYRDLLKENQDVIDAIGGIGGALEDTLQFAGEGGRDVFQNFIEEALANFDRLKKAGFEPGQALATMGPVLTQIQDIAKKFNFTLGENISQLIATADEAGALSEIDPMASAAESLESTAEALERIVQLLSGIPAGAGQALAGVTSMQGMNLQAPITPTVQIPQIPNLQAIMNRGLPPSIPTAGETQPQKIYNITIQPGAVQGGNIDISPTASTQEIAEAIQRDGGLVEIMADKIKRVLGGL